MSASRPDRPHRSRERLALAALAVALLAGIAGIAGIGGIVALRPASAPPPLRRIAVRCGRLIDVETGRVVKNAVILIAGDRVAAVGADLPVPAGESVIDLGAATVLPGLIDAHTHLLSNYDPGKDDAGNDLVFTAMSTATRALLGTQMAREELAAGFTTVRDLGNSGHGGDVALRDAIKAGWVQGPRMVVSTRALAPPGGQFDDPASLGPMRIAREYAEVRGPDDARRAVRQAVADGADLIKVIVDAKTTLSLPEVSAIVAEAHRARRKVAAHATTYEATRIAATAGVDSIEHANEVTDDVLRQMAAKKIFLVPTDRPLEHYLELPLHLGEIEAVRKASALSLVNGNAERLARAVRLGVRIAAGSDNYYAVPGKTRGQAAIAIFRAYAEAGLSPLAILQTGTIRAAELLGLRDRLGSLAPGQYADLIAVPRDPLADIGALADVCFVMQGGVVMRDDLHRPLR